MSQDSVMAPVAFRDTPQSSFLMNGIAHAESRCGTCHFLASRRVAATPRSAPPPSSNFRFPQVIRGITFFSKKCHDDADFAVVQEDPFIAVAMKLR